MAVKLFCYRRGNSVLHKIPALIKILFMIVFCVTCFTGGQMETTEEILQKSVFFQLLYCSCICILLFFLGKGKLSTVLQMKWILWFGLFVTVFKIYPDWKNGLLSGGLYTVRFFFASFACQLIFETTSSLEIREAFEAVHKAVCRILPFMKKFNLAFVISLAVTFIPEVFEKWNTVRLASRARKGKEKRFFATILAELTALLSVLLGLAEIKRKAILNRGFEI